LIARLLAIAAVLVFAAGAAFAETDDTSPDKSFSGFWRVIAAERAPWLAPRPLRAGEAPLLAWMVAFDEGAVAGPPALACASARYDNRQTMLADLFGGRLDPDTASEQASMLGFMPFQAPTQRVLCGARAAEYYLAHNGDVLVASGEIVYRLRRPDGDPREWHAGYSGPGFDCVTADHAGSQIVCDDLRLSGMDRTMTAAYKRLEAAETPASFATVRAAQQAWHVAAEQRCAADGVLPAHAGDVVPLRDCLAALYQDRAALFEGMRVVKAGGLTLEPRMRFASTTTPPFFDSDAVPWLTGGPTADAFNAAVAETLRLDRQRIDDKKLSVPPNMPADYALSARRTYVVMRFDGRLISLQMRTADFTGGTHDQLNEFAINWDLAAGAPLGFASLFPIDKDGLQFVTDAAMKDLTRQFGDEPPPKQTDVATVVADPNDWLFTADAAIVHFPVYTVANFSRGAFDVRIPFTVLKDYLRPDAVVLKGAAP